LQPLFEMDDTPKYMVMNPLFVSRRKCVTDRFYDSVIERLREKVIFLKLIRGLYSGPRHRK
jgi:hypothetical protein